MATWGDYTLRELIDSIKNSFNDYILKRPLTKFVTQPVSTSGVAASITMNTYGFAYALYRNVSGTWINSGGGTSQTSQASIALTGVQETSVCIVRVWPFGYTDYIQSNEFTVTRTAAQTQALKQSTKENTEILSDSTEDVTVEKDVVEPKTTTTSTKK